MLFYVEGNCQNGSFFNCIFQSPFTFTLKIKNNYGQTTQWEQHVPWVNARGNLQILMIWFLCGAGDSPTSPDGVVAQI